MPPAERKRVKDLRVQEISFVDDPAVPKAKWVIMKRDAEGGEMAKCEKCGQGRMHIEIDEKEIFLPRDGESMEAFLGKLAKSLHVALKLVGNYIEKAGGMNDECPEGHEWDEKEGKCVAKIHEDRQGPVCPEHYEWDEEKGRCMPVTKQKKQKEDCPEGMEWNDAAGKCMPIPPSKEEKQGDCPEGHEWDEKEGKCVPMGKKSPAKKQDCPEGQEWDDKEGKCVPMGKGHDKYGYKEPEKKQDGYSCPEGHEWDEKEGKCVPMKKAKPAEGGDKPPKDEGYPNPVAKAAEDVKLSPDQEQRINALLARS